MYRLIMTLLTSLTCSVSSAHSAHHTDHNTHPQPTLASHQHGVAQLNIAQEQALLVIELIAPAADVFGFEHPAQTAEQHQQIQQIEDQLSDALDLFQPAQQAQCELQELQIINPLRSTLEQTHQDVAISYQLTCQHPQALKTLNVQALFKHFPSLQTLQLQLVTEHSQQQLELSSKHPELSL